MKLYSGPLSLFTAKVRIALEEKELRYERVDVPFSRRSGYEPKHPDVVALNPKAQVPVLVDDDVTLYDSTVILEYLEDRHPDPPLYPKDPVERARCRQLELAADEVLFPHVFALVREVFYKPDPAQQDGAAIARAREAIQSLYGELDGHLEGRKWFCEAFGVADIAYALTLLFATQLGAPPSKSLANLQGWLERVSARPSVRKEIAEMTQSAAKLSG